jgi:hypothetical protein
MISALPTTADSGKPPAMLLAIVIRSGSTPACSNANMRPVRAMPDWIHRRSGRCRGGRTARAGCAGRPGSHVEAAFTEHRLDDDRGDARGFHIGLEQLLDRGQRTACGVTP